MPHEFDASKLNVTSGKYGSSDTTNTYYDVSGLTITGGINGPLGPNEGLTVALTLPEGYYQSAKDNNAGFYIMRYLMYGLCVLLVVWAYFTWSRHGRDIQLTPVVGFYPPDGMTPAEVGYIVDGTIDNQDIISLIIYWASKGFLRIEEHSEQDDSLFGAFEKSATPHLALLNCAMPIKRWKHLKPLCSHNYLSMVMVKRYTMSILKKRFM